MSKNSLTVALKQTKIGWCVLLNSEPYAVGSQAYCREISQDLILRYLKHGPDSMPYRVGSKGGAT